MSDTGIFCTGSDVQFKAGAGASSVATGSLYTNAFISQAESLINTAARFNFSDVYGSLNDDTKGVLNDAASNMAAIYVISYDMSGYNSRIDAENTVNILRDAWLRDLALLKDKNNSDFIRGV